MGPSASGLPEYLRDFKCMKGARNRAKYRYDKAPHAATTCSSEIPIPAQRMTLLPDDLSFDEFFGGPTIEDGLEDAVCNFPSNPYATITRSSCWERFKDYGYRLQASFALAFNVQEPILVEEHILPIAPKRTHKNDHVTGGYSLERKSKRRNGRMNGTTEVVVPDGSTMGIEEFLKDARLEGSQASLEAFVNGRGLFGEFIAMDPERDKVTLGRDEVLTRVDIDSMIWVTHSLRFRQALKVFVLPHIGDGPLITHNNHVYVDILLPQSNRDRDDNETRSEWWSRRFPISTIPHTHFAQMSSGAGTLNIYVVFPHMIHKHRGTGHRVAIMPYEVQAMWWSDVVHPALV
jgi:hypothetical protein